MALDTPQSARNLVICEIYIRNHGRNDTFPDGVADQPRIRERSMVVI